MSSLLETGESDVPFTPELPLPEESSAKDSMFWSDTCVHEGIVSEIRWAYDEIMRWSLFMVPTGRIGDAFVSKLSCFFGAYEEFITLDSVALNTAMTVPALLLQRLFAHSKTKDCIQCLKNCLHLWRDGNISQLLSEDKYIQWVNSQPQACYVQHKRKKREHMSSVSMKSSMVCPPPWFSVHQRERGRLPFCPIWDWLPNWQTREMSLIHSAFNGWGGCWTSLGSGLHHVPDRETVQEFPPYWLTALYHHWCKHLTFLLHV